MFMFVNFSGKNMGRHQTVMRWFYSVKENHVSKELKTFESLSGVFTKTFWQVRCAVNWSCQTTPTRSSVPALTDIVIGF